MSESKKIEIGNVVTLKSGGPEMTVSDVNDDKAECVWFSRHEGLLPNSIQFGDRYSSWFPVSGLSFVS